MRRIQNELHSKAIRYKLNTHVSLFGFFSVLSYCWVALLRIDIWPGRGAWWNKWYEIRIVETLKIKNCHFHILDITTGLYEGATFNRVKSLLGNGDSKMGRTNTWFNRLMDECCIDEWRTSLVKRRMKASGKQQCMPIKDIGMWI